MKQYGGWCLSIKIYFYVEFQTAITHDFTQPEKGNPGVGGTEYATISLATELAKQTQHEITIISNQKLTVHPLVNYIFSTDIIEAILSDSVADHYFVYRSRIDIDELFMAAITKTKAKVIAWMHVTPSPKHLLTLAASKQVCGVVSLGNRQFFSWFDNPIAKKTVVIQNGQYPPLIFSRSPSRNVAYLGALVPQKGFHVLAKAWPSVVKRYPDLRLKVIGSGALYNKGAKIGPNGWAEPAYEKQILDLLGSASSSVDFLGKVSAIEKAELIADTYLGIVNPTGNTENCPASALDFQAAGVPVIAAKKYGLIDVVSHKQTGFLVRRERNLSRTIKAFYDEKNSRMEYSRNAINFVENKFDFSKIVNSWIDFFTQIEQGTILGRNGRGKPVNFSERITILNVFLFKMFGKENPPFSVVELKSTLKSNVKKLMKQLS